MADALNIVGIRQICIQFVESNFTKVRCYILFFILGHFFLWYFLIFHFHFIVLIPFSLLNKQVSQTKSFLRLEACLLLEIVLKDTLVVPKEEKVYEAILRWGVYEPETRAESLKQLLTFVRFPLMGNVVCNLINCTRSFLSFYCQ